MSFTLRDAHREYLPEINCCECALCRAARSCTCALCLCGIVCDQDRYLAHRRGLSERLRALVEGRHVHVTLHEYVATLPKPVSSLPPRGYRIGRDDARHGLGIGISRH